jgi:flagellar M-ring protein FliF
VLLSTSSALEPSSVRGIAHLVASSVPGLKLSQVTITEGSGQLLWPTQGSEGGEGSEADTTQAAQTKYDQQAAAGLEAMLAQTLGPGKAQVQVYANLDLNKTTEEQLKYGKNGVPLQQSKNIETLTGNGAGAANGTGTATIPTYATTSGGKSNYKHEVTNTTLGVEKTVTHNTVAPGAVTGEHVSVLLDNSVPASAVPAVREAITNAAGIESKRGDTLSISRMAFAKTPSAAASSSSSMMGYAKDALLGIGAIVFLFFTTRFLRKRERETIDHEPVWLSELEMPMPLSELQRETASPAPEPELVASGSPARQRVEELAASSPDTVAKQLRSWMKED